MVRQVRESHISQNGLDKIEMEEYLMARSSNQIDVYLEIGKKRTFAGVIDWPGWCRSGLDEGRRRSEEHTSELQSR